MTPIERAARAAAGSPDAWYGREDICEQTARAVLAAIEEPTRLMLYAGGMALAEEYLRNPKWETAKDVIENLDLEKIWRAMIKDAMGEGE